ncbi:MAG: DUF962 domain-containing protein [Pseudomonadota bacterium]
MSQRTFRNFSEFYPYYLSEHSDPRCRSLHYIGSMLVLGVLAFTIWTGRWAALWFLPLIGYGFAWAGHFFFEKNRPATFRYPVFSLMGDWVMLSDFVTGRLRRRMAVDLPQEDAREA